MDQLDEQKNKQRIETFALWRRSPIAFIGFAWGLIPQRLHPQYTDRFTLALHLKGKDWDRFAATVTQDWYEPFQEGFHISWQQTLALYGIEKALLAHLPMRLSIVSGHGCGKTSLVSWVILWFLFTHPDAQVACTSPSKEQMYDVLWKELNKWISKMKPQGLSDQYIWEAGHIRMAAAPGIWFARAKTSSKENTEALAGVHGPWVMLVADEASGVEEPIFEAMEGSLTGEHILVFIISNGTRNIGYFYDTHHDKDSKRWQTYRFDGTASPLVTKSSIDGWKDKYGEDSTQYAVRVLGKFPDEGQVDDKGYVPLFSERDIHFTRYDSQWKPVGRPIAAIDPSGEGQDLSAWALRDRFIAAILHTEKSSNPKGLAATSVTLCDKYWVDPVDFVIDSFGSGADISMEMALMTSAEKRPWRVTPQNVGEPCEDEDQREFYINKRAEMFYKMMLWVRAGGSFMELPTPDETERFKRELLSIRFKRTQSGRIQMMSKVEMKKLGFNSPNMADAVALTFLRPDGVRYSNYRNGSSAPAQPFDAHSPLGD